MTSRKGGRWLPNVSYKGQKQQSSYRSDASHNRFWQRSAGCVGEIASLPEQATGCITPTPHESRPRDQNQRACGRAQAPRRPHRTGANSNTGGTLFDKPLLGDKPGRSLIAWALIERTSCRPSGSIPASVGRYRTLDAAKIQTPTPIAHVGGRNRRD